MSEEQKRLLEKQLWAVANLLRGKMNADEYKNYILGFIFYKYLSEKLELYINEKLLNQEDYTFTEIKEETKEGQTILGEVKAACISHLGFFLKPSELFSYLCKKGKGEIKGQTNFILEDLKSVLNTIEQTSMGTSSEDDFKGLFDDVDLTSSKLGSSENKKNDVIVEVLTLLNGIDFRLEDTKSDLLGDAYEYLIGEFAAGAGKKGGEFYTPSQVSRLLSQIVTEGKKRIKSVFDPTCGSGSLLLRVKDYADVANYYGQELNPTTYNLARMNMILHGVHFDNFVIRQGDTLTEDMHPDLQAEVIVANPPFSADWKGDTDPQLAHDERFSQYGRLAPKSAADYAFVTHMLYHLADNGTMAIVLPHGALFRSGAEGHIRKYIIEKQNYLDAVIGLPSNLFYGTSIPATILVFKKCRKDDEDILFIDASKEFEKGKNQNRLTNENITKIFDAYKSRSEIDKYSHKASVEEIKENDYNLNIPRYVNNAEIVEAINLVKIAESLAKLKKIDTENFIKITKYCTELNLPKPDGNNIYFLKEYMNGVIQKIFSRDIRFKDKNGGDFPDWQEKRLDEIGVIVGGGTPDTTKEEYWNGNINWFTPSEIREKYATQSIRKITEEGLKKSSAKILPIGTLLLTSRATIGEVSISTEISTTNQGFQSIVVNRQNSNEFFYYWIKLNQSKLLRLSNGSTFLEISSTVVKSLRDYFPSLPEQLKIADFLSIIDKNIELKQKPI